MTAPKTSLVHVMLTCIMLYITLILLQLVLLKYGTVPQPRVVLVDAVDEARFIERVVEERTAIRTAVAEHEAAAACSEAACAFIIILVSMPSA